VTYYIYHIDNEKHVKQLLNNFFVFKNGNDAGDIFHFEKEDFKLMASGMHDIEVQHVRYEGLATFEIRSHTHNPERLSLTVTECDFPCFAGIKLFGLLLGFHVAMEGSIPCIEIESCLCCPNTSPSVVVGYGYRIKEPFTKKE